MWHMIYFVLLNTKSKFLTVSVFLVCSRFVIVLIDEGMHRDDADGLN